MKALFLIFHGFDPSNGISKKISYQLKALKECGMETHICYMDEHGTKKRMVDNRVLKDYGRNISSKVLKRMELESVVSYAKDNGIDFVYIRSDHNASPFTVNMVKKMKLAGMKVVMEIPTYPYDCEYNNWAMRRRLILDKLFRWQLARQLDAIVTFSEYDDIFGQQTIKISNGIDFEYVKLKKDHHTTDKELNLIGVAEIHRWHGFDRIIRGLAAYYAKTRAVMVRFHVVGYFFSSIEEQEIKELISRNRLESYVILHGKKHGQELDNIFDQCDFGVGSLGRHRVGIDRIKTLKNREYAARGIPFIYSESDSDFDDKPYVYKVPADETVIDIEQLIDFYKRQTMTPEEIRNSISNLSWKCQMGKVLNAIFQPTSNNKRIAYCIPSLNNPGGMERVLTTKANYLAEVLNYDVCIITTDNKGTTPYFTLSPKINVVELDINIDHLWQYPIWKRYYLYLRKMRTYRRKLERCLERIKPAITISLLRREINFLCDLKDGSRKVGEIHFGRYKYREAHFSFFPKTVNRLISKWWMEQLEKKVRMLDRFVVLTNEDAANWHTGNVTVIANPVPPYEGPFADCTAKQVIAVGRYTYQKGFDLLIDAWEIVNRMHPDWTLHIFGSGDNGLYQKLADTKGLDKSVYCHGVADDIMEEYRNSSIFVFSSRFEGFGLALVEAMSVGVPPISFACPCGPRDIITDDLDGILCEKENTDQLARAICRLIEDEQLRKEMGRKAAMSARRYSTANIMSEWDRLLNETCQRL